MLEFDSVKLDGASRVNGVTVVGFSGSFCLRKSKGKPEEGAVEKYNFSSAIFNEDMYNANRDECDSEYERFRDRVKKIAGKGDIRDLLTPLEL